MDNDYSKPPALCGGCRWGQIGVRACHYKSDDYNDIAINRILDAHDGACHAFKAGEPKPKPKPPPSERLAAERDAAVARAVAAEAALAQARGDLRTLAGLAATGDGVYGRLMSAGFGVEGLTNADTDALTRAGIDVTRMSDDDVAEVLRRALR